VIRVCDRFLLSHEFLALMPGVQRSSVTLAAEELQQAGLIRYTHGKLVITDHQGREARACEDCRFARAEHEHLFGRWPQTTGQQQSDLAGTAVLGGRPVGTPGLDGLLVHCRRPASTRPHPHR
jgi:hypothetical protein